MGAINLAEWQKLPMSMSELCINTTLRCGQSFRWRKSDAGVWSIALHNRIIALHQDPEYLYYRSFPRIPISTPPTPPPSNSSPNHDDHDHDNDDTLALLTHYLNLTPDLSALYASWSAADPHFARTAPRFTGVRILAQPAWEALIAFICSSNNNIARITQMVNKLCLHYGPLLGRIENTETGTSAGSEVNKEKREEEDEIEETEAEAPENQPYHDFPTPEALARPGVEAHLRALGFGYRAAYIHRTAQMISEKGMDWLEGLRNPARPAYCRNEKKKMMDERQKQEGEEDEWTVEGHKGYQRAHAALRELSGVGPKVADCVCLMGLGWGEAVPVDTHVWRIAVRDYKFGAGKKGGGGKDAAMTKGVYEAVGNKFRALWGPEAGWAHSVLFTADLRAFSERLLQKEETVEIKEEPGTEVRTVKTTKVVRKAIKRERETGEREVVQVEGRTLRSKRRRG